MNIEEEIDNIKSKLESLENNSLPKAIYEGLIKDAGNKINSFKDKLESLELSQKQTDELQTKNENNDARLNKEISELKGKHELTTEELQNLNEWRRKHLGRIENIESVLTEITRGLDKEPKLLQQYSDIPKKLSGKTVIYPTQSGGVNIEALADSTPDTGENSVKSGKAIANTTQRGVNAQTDSTPADDYDYVKGYNDGYMQGGINQKVIDIQEFLEDWGKLWKTNRLDSAYTYYSISEESYNSIQDKWEQKRNE